MQTQVEPTFKRKARIGINPLLIPDRGTIAVEVKSSAIELFESKKYQGDDKIPFVMAVDLRTGEEGHLWLSGQLKSQLGTLADKGTLLGMKLEIIHKGKQTMKDADGETINVNQYDVFELE